MPRKAWPNPNHLLTAGISCSLKHRAAKGLTKGSRPSCPLHRIAPATSAGSASILLLTMHRMNGDSARRAGRLLASAPLLVVLLLVAQADPAAGQMGVGFDVPNAVIVVGAGMSGIAAARTLADKNIYSIVLEV